MSHDLACSVVVAWLLALPVTAQDEPSHSWGQWRGPLGTGVAPDADPPTHWSETENIRWKTALPGVGYGAPIVFGERVFLTAAVPVSADWPAGAAQNVPTTSANAFDALSDTRFDAASSSICRNWCVMGRPANAAEFGIANE